MNLKFKVLNGGKLPTRAHREDAGFDLYSPINAVLCGGTTRIKLGVCVEIPKGYVGFIMGRSSLNKNGVACLTGVIDSGYTGEIAVILNSVGALAKINKGDRIAQLVVAKLADIDDAVAVDSLEDSERGAGGFGSTGA
uniref:dUTP diphosphatase n=1 Tax=Succinivibrio sp. TaxID=2053619 RepID=UPI003FF06B80